MTRRARIGITAFLFVFACTPLALAEPITSPHPIEITSGYVGLNVSFGIDLGFFEDEFSMLGEGFGGLGPFNDAICATCTPPQTKPEVRLQFTSSDFYFLTLDAPATPCADCVFSGDLLFRAAPTILSPTGNSNPFSMTGTIMGFHPGSNAPLFTTQIFGSGQLITGQQDLVFRFSNAAAPVPEPATLFLCGSGLLGSLIRARRRSVS